MALFGKNAGTSASDEALAYRRDLVENMVFELIPLKSVDAGIEALPANSLVSVTASPVKGLDATMELTDQIRDKGHRPVPHIAARLVEGPEHVAKIAKWMKTEGYETLFCVAGDAEEPAGPYEGAHAFLTDLFAQDHGLTKVGITSYPDGHALISSEICHEQLHAKQALLKEAGVEGWASTQMCFDTDLITSWLTQEKLMAPGSYDPNDILDPMIDDLANLNISGLHVFTFNQVEATEQWRQAVTTNA